MSSSSGVQPSTSPPAGPPSNTMALVGLILGIVAWAAVVGLTGVTFLSLGFCGICTGPMSCLTPLFWVVGVVLSGIGLSEVNKDPVGYSPSSKGLATIGLVINGVGILFTICGLVASVIMIVLGVSISLLSLPFTEAFEGLEGLGFLPRLPLY